MLVLGINYHTYHTEEGAEMNVYVYEWFVPATVDGKTFNLPRKRVVVAKSRKDADKAIRADEEQEREMDERRAELVRRLGQSDIDRRIKIGKKGKPIVQEFPLIHNAAY